jgi:hypothetical protein
MIMSFEFCFYYLFADEGTKRKRILAALGVRKAKVLTPRKHKLYVEYKRASRSAKFYKAKAVRITR